MLALITSALGVALYLGAWLLDEYWHVDYDENDISLTFGKR